MNIFELVKANVTAYDVAVAEGLAPTRNKLICCPFHNEKHPSMKVEKRFFCFACGEKGDVIDFVGKLYGLAPKDAAEKIASDFRLFMQENSSKVKEYRRQKSEQQLYAELPDRNSVDRKRAAYCPLFCVYDGIQRRWCLSCGF